MHRLFVVLLLVAAQDDKPKETHLDKDYGFSINKPPKNENWAIKTDGKKLQDTLIAVQHRIDDLSVEVWSQKRTKDQQQDFDIKQAASDSIKQQEEQKTKGEYKEIKNTEVLKEIKFPGDGAPKCYYYRLTITDKNDRKFEFAEWTFQSKTNKSLYRVFMLCAAGEYEKKKKEVETILASFKTYKLPK